MQDNNLGGENTFSIIYRFNFETGEKKEIKVEIDNHTLTSVNINGHTHPEWTRYKNFKCPNCPVERDADDFCPVAINLEEVIRVFSSTASYDRVNLEIETQDRNYSKETSVQSGVSGIIGILMVTSGCPIMGKLKPMVRFHTPFSSLEETEYRAMSMYLLAQYFRKKWGKEPDWELKNLKDIYENISILNQNVARRIADLESKDASINSLIVLNNFAEYVTVSLDEDMLHELEVLFTEYME